jgi:phosphatidylserine/phosphatidylglycerophosphate/cardiolipin synthase-like enzyme/subtilisin family serine protease
VAKNRFAEFNLDPALAEAVEAATDHQVLEGILRLEDPALIPPEFRVVSQFIRICTGRFLAEHAWTIHQHPNVISLKAARSLGISEGDPSADSASAPAAPPLPFTGRGSIVAALDFGLDFGHPNFRNPDGRTRVMSFWHQGAHYDPAHPNRYGYGRIFSRDEIDAALRAADPYRALGYHPAISDTGKGSHGTHTLDIAAGNGRAPGSHSGIAPEAEIIFVHLSTPRLGVVGDLGDSVRMLEALNFADKTAADRPCVVNLSVGREAGSHDATSPFEQAMHELLRMKSGRNRAICQSAGNYGSAHLAVNGRLRDGEERDLEWIVHPKDVSPEVDLWYSGNDRFRVVLLPPGGGDPVEVRLGETADIHHYGGLVGRIYNRKLDPNNRDNHVELFLYKGAPPGIWILRLIGEYVITGRFHAWIERAIPGAQSCFSANITSRNYTLGTIATSPLVITVGAYDSTREGHPLAPFSSCGPTRDERHDKPELLAPGVRIVAARSIPWGAAAQEGLLMPRSGTSMATPHLTGLVAAMFEAAGRPLSIAEIRDCLERSAEPVIQAETSNCCAWGRVNMQEAIRRIRGPVETAVADQRWITAESESSKEEIEAPLDQGAMMNADPTSRFLDRAEYAVRSSYGRRHESEVIFLRQLLLEAGANTFLPQISPAALFRCALYGDAWTNDLGNILEILGTPLQQPSDELRPGDWIIRAVTGTGDVGHVSILTSELLSQSILASRGILAESGERGHYGLVIEAGAFPHSRSSPLARRMLDIRGRVPQHTLILRPRMAGVVGVAEWAPPEPGESSFSIGGSGPACSVWLASVASANYTDWIAPPTQGRLSLLINGRDSGGNGPDVDLTEPLDMMEGSVRALVAGDFCYLSAWFFEPATQLTAGAYLGETTWGGLFRRKAEEGVTIKILINDFDPLTTLDTWERDSSLHPLQAIVSAMAVAARGRLMYLVSRHPANYAGGRADAVRAAIRAAGAVVPGSGSGPIFIGSHHQKFMVVRSSGGTTAFCGGVDIESRKTPATWSNSGFMGWHDLTVKLEGPITRDVERQFIERWNREQAGARNPLLAGWSSWGTLSQPASLPAADDAPEKKVQNVQLTRTVSSDGSLAAYDNNRKDIRIAYTNIINCAQSFLYLENQYFRDLSLADEIGARAARIPALRVIFVVLDDAHGDDGNNAVTLQGTIRQAEFFSRVTTALGSRVAIYTMFNRTVHSKMIMADDRTMSIGSANANVRSFDLDSELNLTIDNVEWVRRARLRLWEHNLGVSQAAIGAWSAGDFISRWDTIAAANWALRGTPEHMAGEGVLVFNWAANRGTLNPLIPDYLVQLDVAQGPNRIYGPENRDRRQDTRRAIA